MATERLQKFLAAAGHGSRRACEELILAGRVTVDGVRVTKLGTTVDPDIQTVALDDCKLKLPKKVYVLLNKPVGTICSNKREKSGHPLVTDLVQIPGVRLFSVGRLDVDSKGALILSNDGDFTNTVTHPRFDVPKTYHVRVDGSVSGPLMEKLRKGIWLAEGKATPTEVRTLRKTRQSTLLKLTLTEGKNRITRRILAKLKLKVTELERVAIGPVFLGDLKVGKHRRLNDVEVKKLLSYGQGGKSGKSGKSNRSTRR